MSLRLLIFLVASASFGAAAEPLEFSAVLITDGQTRFVLRNPATEQRSTWLKLGEAFDGYTLDAFAPEAEILTVAKNGLSFTLRLKAGKIQSVNAPSDRAPDLPTQLEMARQTLTTLRKRYRDAHPLVKNQLAVIADLERQLMGQPAKK